MSARRKQSDVEVVPQQVPLKEMNIREPIGDNSRSNGLKGSFNRFEALMSAHKYESRGIRRVEPEERHDRKSLGFTQIVVLWFAMNLAANNITLGMLGPVVFGLNFRDAALTAVFGALIGCLPVAYIATFGPLSGNRTLVFARYTMGWWPAKIIVVLNIIISLGYSMVDAVVAGQILSAVSPNGSLSIAVGIIIVCVITWLITTFGYSIVHYYERYALIPQIIVYSILAGVAGPNFSLYGNTEGDSATRVGNRLSFFSLCLSAAITYAGLAADFFVYYPEDSPRWKVFGSTMLGLITSFTWAFLLGIGLAAGSLTNDTWHSAYKVSQGALMVEGNRPLGGFGSFCSVLIALGLVGNMIPPTYCSGLDLQILGRWPLRVPRAVWNTLGVIAYTVCALAGRYYLAEILINFLALMGYWVSIWIAITLEEHFIFKKGASGFNWAIWNEPSKLPIGLAAITAFLIGYAGAVLSMAQVWYIGPIAKLVGEYGADMGNYIGFALAAIIFPPLRYLELKRFGR